MRVDVRFTCDVYPRAAAGAGGAIPGQGGAGGSISPREVLSWKRAARDATRSPAGDVRRNGSMKRDVPAAYRHCPRRQSTPDLIAESAQDAAAKPSAINARGRDAARLRPKKKNTR